MSNISEIVNGSPTSVAGFTACGVTAGFKRSGAPDFAMLYSEDAANCAGVFTSCRFAAAPVLYDKEILSKPDARIKAVIINSGIANACTGQTGLENSRKSAALVASKMGIPADQVAVASTGRIGVQLTMDTLEKGIELAIPALSADGGNDASRAIMTTDTVPKAVAFTREINGVKVTVGAMTKGAGMIAPDLQGLHATMLCFITTDVKADNSVLAEILEECAEESFNRITVDGDMSTNDTVLVLSNGRSNLEIKSGTPEAAEFKELLLTAMKNLARRMVMDGEGATKFVTVEVVNAKTKEDAALASRAVADSLLCKTAWFGNDPNWGRVVAALGYSGAIFDPAKVDVFFGPLQVVKNGGDAGTPEADLVKVVSEKEFVIRCDFHDGDANHWIWTSDVSYEYVKINADYHT